MAGSNGAARGFAIPISAFVGIAATVVIAVGSYAAAQFNQLRLDFEHERLQARREYADDISKLRAELRAALERERDETQAMARDLSERIDEALALGREVNHRQDELIERVRQHRHNGDSRMP
jgi:hypothetical protein